MATTEIGASAERQNWRGIQTDGCDVVLQVNLERRLLPVELVFRHTHASAVRDGLVAAD